MKIQINSTREITQSYKKLESDYHHLSELYSKRIEQSHEVAEMLSKDITTLESNFRNTSSLQIDSQDEL
jgi:Txe/YoeB family toxin of Txe-Axe toxin-antitoxin module